MMTTLRKALSRLWGWLTRTAWFVDCDVCQLRFGAIAPGMPGQAFNDRETADATAAVIGGWVIGGGRALCPRCARAERSPDYGG